MSNTKDVEKILSHYKFAIQAAMESFLEGSDRDLEKKQTEVGLYLHSVVTALSEMEEKEFRKEIEFFTNRPVHKIQGLIL